MGRPTIYRTKTDFEAAVDGYFASISRLAPVTECIQAEDRDGNLIYTEKGKPVMRRVPVCNGAGEPLIVEEFLVPPTISGLCRHLGISRETWSQYGKRNGFADTVTRARARVEQYLEEQLISRNKQVQGVIFNLTNNFDWKERREVSLDKATADRINRRPLTMAEKMALLTEVAAEIGGHDPPAE